MPCTADHAFKVPCTLQCFVSSRLLKNLYPKPYTLKQAASNIGKMAASVKIMQNLVNESAEAKEERDGLVREAQMSQGAGRKQKQEESSDDIEQEKVELQSTAIKTQDVTVEMEAATGGAETKITAVSKASKAFTNKVFSKRELASSNQVLPVPLSMGSQETISISLLNASLPPVFSAYRDVTTNMASGRMQRLPGFSTSGVADAEVASAQVPHSAVISDLVVPSREPQVQPRPVSPPSVSTLNGADRV